MSVSDLGSLIAEVHAALTSSSLPPAAEVVAEKEKPVISVRKSIQDDKLTCLECWLAFESLKRHLRTNHSLLPEEYREKRELSSNYPMVAPAYAEARSRLAKESGLGQSRRQKVA